MRSMQNKVLKTIEAKAAERGLEAVQKEQWANTGTIFVQKPGEFNNLLVITYTFNDSHMDLTLKVGDKFEVPNCQRGRTDGYVKWYMNYEKSHEVNEFFGALWIGLCQQTPGFKQPRAKRAA